MKCFIQIAASYLAYIESLKVPLSIGRGEPSWLKGTLLSNFDGQILGLASVAHSVKPVAGENWVRKSIVWNKDVKLLKSLAV